MTGDNDPASSIHFPKIQSERRPQAIKRHLHRQTGEDAFFDYITPMLLKTNTSRNIETEDNTDVSMTICAASSASPSISEFLHAAVKILSGAFGQGMTDGYK